MYKKKLFSFGLAMTMILSMTACSFTTVKTVEDLEKQYKKASESMKNFEIEGETILNIGITAEESGVSFSMDMPIELEYEAKTDGKENLYMELDMSMTVAEESESTSLESYFHIDDDKLETWSKEDDGLWLYSETDLDSDFIEQKDDSFLSGELEVTEESYIVKQSLESIFESEQFQDLLDNVDSENTELSEFGLDIEDLIDSLGEGIITYTFDKETFYLTGVDISNIEYEAKIEGVNFSLTMESKNELKNYNELDEDDYVVPKDVKDEAVENEDFEGDFDILGSGESIFEPSVDESTSEIVSEEEIKDSTEEVIEASEENNVSIFTELTSNDWRSGEISIDGQVLTLPCSYEDIKAFGYEMTDYDNEVLNANTYTFVIPVENKDGKEFYISLINIADTYKPYTECIVFGLSWDDYMQEDNVKLCNGICLGMAEDDMLAIMGEANSVYKSEDSSYHSYEYYYDPDVSYDGSLTITADEGVVIDIDYEYMKELLV